MASIKSSVADDYFVPTLICFVFSCPVTSRCCPNQYGMGIPASEAQGEVMLHCTQLET